MTARPLRWLKRRHELLAELSGVERMVTDLSAALERSRAATRSHVNAHESALRDLDTVRSELDARDALAALDEIGDIDHTHRHCVPLSTHMAAVNELDRYRTTPRTGGHP